MRLALAREHEVERILGAGLADRAGDGNHARVRARPRRAREIDQRGEHVGHDEERRVGREKALLVGGDDRKSGAGVERRGDEVMAVAVLARDGEEGFAACDGAAVDREAGHARGQIPPARRAHGSDKSLDGPQRPSAHATFSPSAAATAA